ncbi:MAG: WalW protein [Acidimicrobiia bacterium]|nr:WalW protein [Acidimicrobiia bacterium]
MTPSLAPTPADVYGRQLRRVALPPSAPPVLFVVIDTEEEFDWQAPFSRERVSVRHLRQIEQVQAIFDRHQVRPTYVVDYPVASQPDGYEPLGEIARAGRATIGTHVHPWVTPPFEEPVSTANSFLCNLPAPLQRAKMEATMAAVEAHMGVRPTVFKAGRYALGAETVHWIEELGFEVDQSIMPHYDFSAQRGPSYLRFTAEPFLFGPRRLLALPCSCDVIGMAGRSAASLRHRASAYERFHVPGLLARLRIADRLVLSPEGFSLAEMKRLATHLVRRGTRILTLTLHSTSIEPGHTPYVRSHADQQAFLARLEAFLRYFFRTLGGVTTTPEAFRDTLLAAAAADAAAGPVAS